MKRFLHIVLVLLLAAACKGPRVIPKDTLADIYTDMFLADQKVRDLGIPRVQMDTMLVYEAVFEKYGYDTDDYLYTVRYYLKDPERFAKVLETVTKRLEGEVNALDKVIKQRDLLASKMRAEYPLVDSVFAAFSKESVFLGLARVERDMSRYPAWFRLVPVQEDTLMVPVDSVKAKKDTMPAEELEDEEDAELEIPSIIQETRSRVPIHVIPRELPVKEEIVEEVEDVE